MVLFLCFIDCSRAALPRLVSTLIVGNVALRVVSTARAAPLWSRLCRARVPYYARQPTPTQDNYSASVSHHL